MNIHCKRGEVVQKVDPVVERAIKAAVDAEALKEWASRAPVPLPAFTKPAPFKLTPTSALVLGRQMIKRSISIVNP